MNKTKILLSTLLLLGTFGTVGYCASVNKLEPITNLNNTVLSTKSDKDAKFDTETVYYPNANIKSAVSKYKNGNFTGCLQELFSLVKKDPDNSYAYYYMALAYANIGMDKEAAAAYDKVIELSPDSYISEFAEKGKDCLTGGPLCKTEEETASSDEESQEDELDKFINAPYGNGLSPQLNKEIKQKELSNIKEKINTKDSLELNDYQKIKEFDRKNSEGSDNQSYNDEAETVKIAQASDEDILNAIKTLKDAGVTVTVNTNPYANAYQDPQMAELSMMLGSNNNNNGSMMNMLPMLMAQNQEGKNIDPRMIQAMMMNSMMTDFTFSDNDKNRY